MAEITEPIDETLEQQVKEALTQEESQEQPLLDPIIVDRPMNHFEVMSALAKNKVYFIDLETGEYIDGLLSVPSIGLSLKPPYQKTDHIFGFCDLAKKNGKKRQPKPDIEPDTFEIDAVLYFKYDGPVGTTGYLSKDDAYLYYIKIWNDIDMRFWLDIVEKVVAEYTEVIEGVNHERYKFIVSSAFVPLNPGNANRLIMNKKSGYSDSTYAVSHTKVGQQDDYFEDDLLRNFKPNC